jgi:hypothetical protein
MCRSARDLNVSNGHTSQEASTEGGLSLSVTTSGPFGSGLSTARSRIRLIDSEAQLTALVGPRIHIAKVSKAPTSWYSLALMIGMNRVQRNSVLPSELKYVSNFIRANVYEEVSKIITWRLGYQQPLRPVTG